MIHKVELSGIIKYDYSDDWQHIKLIQPDGYEIDLVTRFQEIDNSYPKAEKQINYWISDKLVSKIEMTEGWLAKISGAIDAEYQANHYNYSSWTSGTDYDTVLSIGGHDLYRELREHDGRFIILEINVLP